MKRLVSTWTDMGLASGKDRLAEIYYKYNKFMLTDRNHYALISVFDKTGLSTLAQFLVTIGYKIIATEGTGAELKNNSIDYIPCQTISQNPKCFDGCMKSLSFFIESGIFYDRTNKQHAEEAKIHDVKEIDFVICNFFPVAEALREAKGLPKEDAVRHLDFGGPIMVRTAALNFKNVTVITDPSDYKKVIDSLRSGGVVGANLRHYLATKAFRHIIDYDRQVVNFLNGPYNPPVFYICQK